MAPIVRSYGTSYRSAIVSIALYCIISELKRDIGRKSRFFILHVHSTPPLGDPRRNIAISFGTKKTRMAWLPDGEKSLRICLAVSTDRRVTDERTDGQRRLATA